MAEKTLEAMQKRGLPVRGISIRAKEKICLNEEVACRPESCPYPLVIMIKWENIR